MNQTTSLPKPSLALQRRLWTARRRSAMPRLVSRRRTRARHLRRHFGAFARAGPDRGKAHIGRSARSERAAVFGQHSPARLDEASPCPRTLGRPIWTGVPVKNGLGARRGALGPEVV